jgi:iron(III) transport system permease protein
VLPAFLAGALVAFLQAMTLFGSPAILALPAGFHTMTTKIWSLFQYPPKPELAAAASLPLLIITVILLRGQAMILGRKGFTVVGGKGAEPRLIKLGWWLVPAGGFVLFVLMLPVFLPYFALFNAAFAPIATTLVTPERVAEQRLSHSLSRKTALRYPFVAGLLRRRHVMALVIGYIVVRGSGRTRRSAFSPPRRWRSPASCSASACS